MFKKVLVANRGEIAVRILRACEERGLETVAVYSEADRNALHVRYANEAYLIGPPPSKESYLRIDKIIDVAKKSGADAIHPGYGFLAENDEFAQACIDEGLTFIGPTPESMRLMGDKVTARRTMMAAGVPVVPGSDQGLRDDEILAEAERIGYPLLIKASAGGGGKGMRVVRKAEELEGSLGMARREAMGAFGDDTVYMEKLIERPRHVEIQILGDMHGNVIHLGERECSIQRRHQKLIEESPSVAVNDAMRAQMGDVAVKAAKAANYVNAGTLEFLVDQSGNFYFLEMNTRLQVEHPVTEMVTGVDIVKEMLAIASGRRLRWRQEDIRPKGWAIECRITAEDPINNFMPSGGKITTLQEPTGPGVRVESGIYEGFEISLFYDPMIAKLIGGAKPGRGHPADAPGAQRIPHRRAEDVDPIPSADDEQHPVYVGRVRHEFSAGPFCDHLHRAAGDGTQCGHCRGPGGTYRRAAGYGDSPLIGSERFGLEAFLGLEALKVTQSAWRRR